ncbi:MULTISPECIES: ATP-binding protein [unclassified Polaribacter]|uniref:GAF domain-containing sensor histidine kinase n=1 Tax=unclassified Polaribacter TaxID=196858 RepID=UPI00052CB800|nr:MULTISPECIES: ATP-binding protein [unclassified Polaribacter]KGL60810.1 two-component system sensor histidine kinase [Polaribacter sp. Hel1_33_49]PKV64899.1 PAS domain S-box-containing protein [Polaribacter sp. Hel1_33_96]
MIKKEIFQRELERQKKARALAEEILESKSLELYNTAEELKKVNKKLEDLLVEKNSQLQGVFENINDAYIAMDLEGNVLKINDIAESFFGYNFRKEAINVLDLIYEEDYTYAMESFAELIKKGYFYQYTARIITKSKKIKWVQINASIIFDNSNNAIGAQGIIRDITEEREKKIILDLNNNIAKSILGKENITEIAWLISNQIASYLGTNDCVIYLVDDCTNTLEQIAASGNKLSPNKEILNKIIIPIGKGIVGEVANTGKYEIINDTSKDERYIIDDEFRFSEITVPIISDGHIIGVIDAEHKEKNYFKKEHVTALESTAVIVALQFKSALNLRERKEAETKNVELLRKLEKSNQELQEYAHIVSHDLKSPLRSITALISWIKTDNINVFDGKSLQNFQDLDLTLETMDNLITDVLKYASLDANVSNDEYVKLDPLIRNLINVLYIPKNISINILNKLPSIKGDKTKFQQLFQNLIGNAIKFSNKKEGFINIDVEDFHSFYKFSIKDNGIGIEKRHFERIFKIFQSLEKSKDSSGIGLSIVKKIVDIYKGEVWLESEIDKGTIFYFTLKK